MNAQVPVSYIITVDDRDASMPEFFLMNRLRVHKRLLEEGPKLYTLIESDHTIR